MELTVLQETVLKPSLAQSATLPAAELAPVHEGTLLPVLAYRQENDHVVITLDPDRIDLAKLHPSRKNTWYCYDRHLEDPTGMGPSNNPKDEPPARPSNPGIELTFPGFQGVYHSGEAICRDAESFTWGEALHVNETTGRYRKPVDAAVVYNILRMAPVLQEIRHKLGDKPLIINSWYRDPATNRAVGGASRSRHMVGDAVDFRVSGMTPWQVYHDLNSWWGNRGGLAAGKGFTHLDGRGYEARWT
jgi:hypothetical protein